MSHNTRNNDNIFKFSERKLTNHPGEFSFFRIGSTDDASITFSSY